ncbi:transposase [Streptomyces pactum]|uniref:Transposase n=1 Tax=Streptomyces pactum TaxID=68249 RepID=A0A1S6J8V2_9ACTN|nr:hypothetical protein B1H29_15790 [Streptomyces pactum]
MAETGKPLPEVARDLEINETTLASWVSRAKRAGNGWGESEAEELARLRRKVAQIDEELAKQPRGS